MYDTQLYVEAFLYLRHSERNSIHPHFPFPISPSIVDWRVCFISRVSDRVCIADEIASLKTTVVATSLEPYQLRVQPALTIYVAKYILSLENLTSYGCENTMGRQERGHETLEIISHNLLTVSSPRAIHQPLPKSARMRLLPRS